MYGVVLALHNIFRWVVLLLAVLVLYRAISGWLLKRSWQNADRTAGLFFSISIDIQLLLGLILYLGLSPFALKGMLAQGVAFVMGNSEYRFYAVEHIFFMGLAVVFAHLGSILPKRVHDPIKKHQRAAIWFSFAIVLIVFGIPWGRPFFPNF